MTYSEIKEIYNDIKKDKFMIYIFRGVTLLIFAVLLFAIAIFIHHAVKDKPARLLFGLAEINTVKTDTVFKIVQQQKDTVFKETIRYVSSENSDIRAKMYIKHPTVDTVSKNKTVSSGSNAHNITGNGNVVGVNGDVVNGIKQRHLNDAVLAYIRIGIKNKTDAIQFLFAKDKETLNYANEIYNAMIKMGYTNIQPGGWMDPDDYDKVYFKKEGNSAISLRICPSSNVQ